MASYNSIVSGVGKYGRAAETAVNRIYSIFSGDDNTSSSIRDRYLNGFLGDTAQFTPNVFARMFDEPTYLTFRIEFDFETGIQNKVKYKGENASQNFDMMPEPLLNTSKVITDTQTVKLNNVLGIDIPEFVINLPVGSHKDSYSTIDYLANAKSENKRAAILYSFVESLKDIQYNYPYYFQSIDGLGDLMKIHPDKGIRLIDGENNILTIKCLEGLDMKITQLMQMYRKVVWDDYYQRWVLPDMMRYFHMKIYVSEIRLFHSGSSVKTMHKSPQTIDVKTALNATSLDKAPNGSSVLNTVNNVLNDVTALTTQMLGTRSTVTSVVNSVGQTFDTLAGLGSSLSSDYYRLCNNAINNVMPTICFDCHQCEFVIDDTLPYINSLNAHMVDKKPVEPTIKIKVGRVLDEQVYPLNRSLTPDSNNEYEIDKLDEYAKGTYFKDDDLRKPYRKGIQDDNLEPPKKEERITNTMFRMNRNVQDKLFTNKFGELSYRPLHATSKESAMSLLKSVLNFFTQDEARSAATTIDSIKEYIYYGDVIRSVATSDENKEKIADGVFVNTLEEIVKSKATDGETALTALSEHILDSLATNGELKIKS